MLKSPNPALTEPAPAPAEGRLAPVFDVAIIGSGLAGASLACILAKAGLKTAVFDAGQHPRFAIGESMILETSEIMRSLARRFDVPELEYFSSENFLPSIGTSHGVKRHFGFLSQRQGEAHGAEDAIQAIIPGAPYGHELHIFRQDSDAMLCAAAVGYGARVYQNSPVTDVVASGDGVSVHTGEKVYGARFVVDAGGAGSVLARKNGVRHDDLRTQSRAIFTHMTGVTPVGIAGKLPFAMAEGTLHHVFEGGWLWVIPFNNHAGASNSVTSVGLMLDPRVFPEDQSLDAEAEFRSVISRFPDLEGQFERAQPVRPWVRTGRIQYSAHELVGDRTCLLGHAAGFVDPLFSKGLYTSLSAVMDLAEALIEGHKDRDYSVGRLAPITDKMLGFIEANDRLVANAYKSFAVPALWRRYCALWITGAYHELIVLTVFRLRLLAAQKTGAPLPKMPLLRLVGGGYGPFDELADAVDRIVERLDVTDEAATARALDEIDALYAEADWMPESHKAIAGGARHLPTRKYSPKLFLRKGGVLGRPDYRKHFFGDVSLFQLARFLLTERFSYSRRAIKQRQTKRNAEAIYARALVANRRHPE